MTHYRIEVLRYCADLIGTSETVRAALVDEIALINREVHHRLATSVHILAQQTKEAQRAKKKKEPVDSPLNVISRHVGIVSSVMDDLREITRKKRPLQIAEVALYDVLCQVRRVDHKVQVLGPHGLSKNTFVRADPEALRYCLDCIVQNAFEAIEVRRLQDSLALHVEHSIRLNVEESQQHVRIGIEDTGVGFTAEIKERLFLPLFSTKTRGLNEGIGLYSVRRMIEEMGGQVDADSPGEFQGASFLVVLPRA